MAANRDDILLQRLQSTIDAWNSEVTAAHEGLARQIGDARHQLITLVDALNKRGKNGNGNSSDTLRTHALRERDAALDKIMRRNRDLEASVVQLQDERRDMHGRLEAALAEMEDLRGQVAAYQDQEASAARLIEKTEKELDALRRSVDATSNARAETSQELERLKSTVDASKKDRAATTEERDRLREELAAREAELDHAVREIASLTRASERLGENMAGQERQFRARLEELDAEASKAGSLIEEQKERIGGLTSEKNRLTEQIAILQTDLDAANARAEHLEQDVKRIDALRSAHDELAKAECALRAELEAAQKEAESLRQAELDLRDELASLNDQYKRQSARLAETVRELESHWELSKEANHRDASHAQAMAKAQDELESARNEIARLTQQASQRKPAKAESGNWQLESRLTELTKENDQLRRLLEQRESGAQATADADLDAVRQELLAFEQMLVEREEAVEAAAARMQKLEETALRVQAEVSALRTGQTPSDGSEETAALRGRVRQLETANAEQAARIVEQEVELSQRADEVAALQESMAAIGQAPEVPEEVTKPSFAFDATNDHGEKMSMGEILVEAGIITNNQLASALDEQRTAKKRRLGSILVEKGLIREEIVAQVVASQLQLPFVRLSETKTHRGAVALLDGRLATHHMCFPVAATTAEVVVAMANPLDLIAVEDLEFATHLKVRPVVATLSDITSAIVEHYGVTIANTLAEDTFDVQTPPRVPSQQRPQA